LDPKSEVEVQGAIDAIAKSSSGLTIIIIAHRLTTVASADNLLFFKSKSELVSAAKGTADYNEIFEKLQAIQYAQGDKNEDDAEADDSMFEEIKEEVIKAPNQQYSINRNSGIDEDLLKTPEGKPSPFISNTGGSSGDLGQYSSAGLLDKLGADAEQ
jgi:ABC-type multidrug transport system ATPase subunit